MFSNCSSLNELNLSTFNTEKVKDMKYMFGECYSLKKINITNFRTDKINDISYMFFKCSSLEKIYFPKMKINNVFIKNIFYGYDNLKEIIIQI